MFRLLLAQNSFRVRLHPEGPCLLGRQWIYTPHNPGREHEVEAWAALFSALHKLWPPSSLVTPIHYLLVALSPFRRVLRLGLLYPSRWRLDEEAV
jgi:hypothetical protein